MYLIVPAAILGVAINQVAHGPGGLPAAAPWLAVPRTAHPRRDCRQDHESPFEMCWAFSIYLEAVAILPQARTPARSMRASAAFAHFPACSAQLFMLQKQGGAESLTSHYILLLGMYRLFYLLNWIYRCATRRFGQPRRAITQPLPAVAGMRPRRTTCS